MAILVALRLGPRSISLPDRIHQNHTNEVTAVTGLEFNPGLLNWSIEPRSFEPGIESMLFAFMCQRVYLIYVDASEAGRPLSAP
jgi:hypothetical protein